MKKSLLVLFAAIMGSIVTSSAQQIPNNGFEEWEGAGPTLEPVSWDKLSGKVRKENSVTFTTQSGPWTVTPHSGSWFMGIATDTMKVNDTLRLFRGSIKTQFAFTERPTFLSTYLMYTPASNQPANQRFGIGIVFYKKNGSGGSDTIVNSMAYLPQEATVFPFQQRIWNLTSAYRNTMTPDSAIIYLYSDITNVVGFNSTLWVDNMSFHNSQPVGVKEGELMGEFKTMISSVSVYPNPSVGNTVFNYNISNSAQVKLTILDMAGREVTTLVNGNKMAGNHQATLERNDLKAGMYFYRLQAGNKVETGKFIIAD